MFLPTLHAEPATPPPAPAASSPEVAWPHQHSDLKADAKLTFGKLDNGLRYVILPNTEPQNRVSLRLYLNAGSLHENDDQQGLAHFLEHMAFGGSKNFAAGELVEYFQRLGMAFGADTNAHTSFRETVYKLELPTGEDKILRQSMQLFRDYADGLFLNDKEIEKERGIILSEKLARDSAGFRAFKEEIKFTLPEAKVSNRLPIGTEEVIKNAPRERFVEFYQKYYTLDRMTLVAVGPVEPAAVAGLIKEYFAGAPASAQKVPEPDLGKITAGRGLVAKLHVDAELPQTSVSISTFRPYDASADSAEKRFRDLKRGLADRMLSRRLEILVKKKDSPLLEASSFHHDFVRFVRNAGVEVTCKPELWAEALATAEQELRRALTHGFSASELAEAKANVLNHYVEEAKQANTRKSAELANDIVKEMAEERVFTHPEDDLARIRGNLEKIHAEDCLAALKEDWDTKDIAIFVGGNVKVTDEGSKAIISTFEKSRAIAVEAPKQMGGSEFAYHKVGEAGAVVATTEHKDLEVTQLTLSNGVKVNLKPTNFQAGVIHILANIGGGLLEAPLDQPGLPFFAEHTLIDGGLIAHSQDELQSIFAGKTVEADFKIAEDAFQLSGTTSPKDLDDELQLLCAYIMAPGYREEAERLFRNNLDGLYTQLEHTLEGQLQLKVAPFLRSGDPRFGLPRRAELEKRTLEEAKLWLNKALTEGAMELTVIGDFKAEEVLPKLLATFGALPKRATTKPDFEKERKVAFPKEPKQVSFPYQTDIPRAMAAVYWPTTDMTDIRKTRRLGVLGSVLSDRLRLKVREELGESYSPNARNAPSDTFNSYGYMGAMIMLKPEQAETVGPIVQKLAQEMADQGVQEDELKRALEPQLTALRQMRRDNGYWLMNVLRNSQEQPRRLEWARTILEDVQSITTAEVSGLAKEYLGSDRSILIKVLPEAGKGKP